MSDDVKRLYRSRNNRMLGGVASGLGDYLDVDATLLRLIFAFSFLLWGTGILVYLVMWIVVSKEPISEAKSSSSSRQQIKMRMFTFLLYSTEGEFIWYFSSASMGTGEGSEP